MGGVVVWWVCAQRVRWRQCRVLRRPGPYPRTHAHLAHAQPAGAACTGAGAAGAAGAADEATTITLPCLPLTSTCMPGRCATRLTVEAASISGPAQRALGGAVEGVAIVALAVLGWWKLMCVPGVCCVHRNQRPVDRASAHLSECVM
jgi:hypothetical protein